MASELKPCKFCGTKPLVSENNVPGNWYAVAECDNRECPEKPVISGDDLADVKAKWNNGDAWNTRPAPAATDTGLVTAELRQEIFKLAKGLFWRVDGNQRLWSGEEREVYGLRAAMQIARSQAEELLAAERAEKEELDAECRVLAKRCIEKDARIKELDRCHEGTIDLCNQKTALIEALEAKLATANALVTCCCGDPVDTHNMGSGHSPVDQYHYAMMQLEAKLAAAEKALERMVSEYDEVDLSHDEPPSMTSAVMEARAVLGGKPAAHELVEPDALADRPSVKGVIPTPFGDSVCFSGAGSTGLILVSVRGNSGLVPVRYLLPHQLYVHEVQKLSQNGDEVLVCDVPVYSMQINVTAALAATASEGAE